MVAIVMTRALLNGASMEHVLCMGRSKLAALRKEPDFPKPIAVVGRPMWFAHEVSDWLEARKAEGTRAHTN